MKTLYLHIGTPKTGTTAIQMMCWENADALAKKGICYPHLKYEYPRVRIRRNGHFLVGQIFQNGKRRTKLEEEIREEGVTTVLDEFKSFDSVVLSDENLWTAFAKRGTAQLEYLKKRCDEAGVLLKVIVYLRRQDELLESWCKQQIKEIDRTFSKSSVEETYEGLKHAFSYYENVNMLAGAVGRENLVVKRFDRSDFVNGTIQSDFFGILGVDDISDLKADLEEPNTSLSGNVVEMVRALIKSTEFTPEYRWHIKTAARFASYNSEPSYRPAFISDEEAAQFMDRFFEDNAKLAREYFGREDGVLFRPRKAGEVWSPDNPYIFADMVNFFSFLQKRGFEKNLELRDAILESDSEFKEKTAALDKRIRELEESFPTRVSKKLGLDRIGRKKTK